MLLNLKITAYKLIGTLLLSIVTVNLAHAATTLSLAGGALSLDYAEFDTQNLTSDGVLNSETGTMPLGLLELSSSLPIKSSQIWGALGFEYAKGWSQYDGYLQSGRNLLAYKSTTMNIFTSYNAKLGMTVNYKSSLLMPYIGFKQTKWQRQLDKYTEYYKLPSWQVGISWQLPVGTKWQLTPELSIGRFSHSKISVPFYHFNAAIKPNRRLNILFGVKANFFIDTKINIMLKINASNYRLLASAVDNLTGLQLPPSKTIQYQSVLGVNFNY